MWSEFSVKKMTCKELALKQTQLSARPTNPVQDLDPFHALHTEREKLNKTYRRNSSAVHIVWRSLLATDESVYSTRLGGQKGQYPVLTMGSGL